MSVIPASCGEYFIVRCDGHGDGPYLEGEDGYLAHFASEADALAAAKAEGWTTDGRFLHCPVCSRHRPLVDPNPPAEPVPVIRGQIPLGAEA